MDDEHIVTLRCKYCSNEHCTFYPIGCYYTEKSGCTRRISEEQYAKYIHLTTEVLPFTKVNGFSAERVVEAEEFLEEIYNCKGTKLNHYGKLPIR